MNKKYLRRLAAMTGVCLLLAGCRQNDYVTIHPDVGPLESLVSDTGTVAHRDPYTLIPVVNGKILSCAVEAGDEVKAGDELYVIDSTDLENQIEQTALSLATAEEGYRQALDAQSDLTVRAKAAGTVTAVHVHVGDFVDVGTPVAQLVDSRNLTLTVPFSKSDAAAIVPGSAATVSFAAYSGQVAATVARVYDAPIPLSGGREGVYIEFSMVNPGALASGTVAMATVGAMASMENGQIAYATEQAIYSTQAGQILSLPMKAGSTVTAGQTVMTIDNASITNAVNNAALSLESARVALSQLEAKRDDFRILAPTDGIVTARYAKAGDYAAAANPLAVIVEPKDMCVNVNIDELYIEKLWPGQEATVTFTTDSGEQHSYSANVTRIDDTGITVGGVTDYTVELSLEDTDGLKSGMNVTVTIVAARRESCLQVPSAAVTDGVVQVLRDGNAEAVAVTTGVSANGRTEIIDGLTEADEVILP